MTETTTETNALVSLNLNLPAPTVVAEQVNKAFHTIYGKIEEEIASFVPDVTTEKGRQAIASLAYKIARTKTGLDEAAKNVTADQKQIIDAVNAERSKMREDLDALKEKVRAPLDAWQAAEEERKREVNEFFARLLVLASPHEGDDSAAIMDRLHQVEAMGIKATIFQDQTEAARDERTATMRKIEGMADAARKREAEAAELEQLRREKAEREEKERQEREAEEARKREEEEKRRQEEERARIAKEAEEKAAALRMRNYKIATDTFANQIKNATTFESRYIADFIQHDEDMNFTDDAFPAEKIGELEAARAETIARLKQMEADRKAEEKAEVERLVAEREAEEKRREEEAAAKAEEDAKRREEEAARKERERIQQEKDEEERQRLAQEKADQERAADLAHRKKVNSAATAAIMKAAGVSEADAQAIVIAIYKGQVPNVAISY